MPTVDMNLLLALDVLLREGSVTAAAQRLGLSISAMSRTLARLRSVTGDPLLVRAGRGLVPTPRAIELRDQVRELTRDVQTVLSPKEDRFDITSLERVFTIRANEGFINLFSAPLVTAVTEAAPLVCLRFAPKPVKDALPLREGQIDLEIGVLGTFAPEIRTQSVFRDKFVGVVRSGHSLLTGRITAGRYAESKHVVVSRKEIFLGPVDDALKELGYKRRIAAVVPGFPDAMRIARQSDLVALVPRSCLGGGQLNVDRAAEGLTSFELPVATPEILISAMWHPRMDADPAHRWLRNTVITICREMAPQ